MIKRRTLFQIACDRCGRNECFTEDHDNPSVERRLLAFLVTDGWDVSISRQAEFQIECPRCIGEAVWKPAVASETSKEAA